MEEVFEKAGDRKASGKGRVVTAGGTHRLRKTRVRSLGLGGYEHRGLIMGEAKANAIGLDLLCRYVVTLDFVGMRMYLRKGKGFDQPVEKDMSGLSLRRQGGWTIVRSVERESPAAAAGIRPEDVVLTVGRTSAAEMGIEDIRDLLEAGDGKKIKLTIKREGEEKAISFRLKKMS